MNLAAAHAAPGSPPSRLRTVDLSGPAGKLEAVLNEGSSNAQCAALVCHPHPMGGGTLHNKVVYHAMKALNAPEFGFGWPVLRFNFRGTGRSEGEHHGRDEVGDVQAALDWLVNAYNLPIVVAGFSFGAAMALQACCSRTESGSDAIRAVVALGLPTHARGRDYHYGFLKTCKLPKLFISGDSDPFAPAASLVELCAEAAEPKHLALIPGADHFFKGQLASMQGELTGWLSRQGV